jgi:hypothetical protein
MHSAKRILPSPALLGLLTAVAAVLAVTVLPAPAEAAKKKHNVRIGIGDQNFQMFDQPDFKKTKVKRVRYFIPWNAMRNPAERDKAAHYIRTAKANKVSVMLHLSSDNLVRKKAKLPSKKRYRREATRLVKYFRKMGVREWGSRNEANHDSQATYKSAKRTAFEFKVVRKAVRKSCKSCTVIGLDVLDQKGAAGYVKRFFRALGKHKRYINTVGIHNYSDVNRRRMSGTRSIMKAVRRYRPKAKFWLTETGGLVKFGKSFKWSTKRAAKRANYLFKTIYRFRKSITRVYYYSWFGGQTKKIRFDAGLVNGHGKPRPALKVFKKKIRRYKR